MAKTITRRKPAGKSTTESRRGRPPRTFTRAELDKVLSLRKQGISWDGDDGIVKAIGASSATQVRAAMREAGGKYEEALSARPKSAATPAAKTRTARKATRGRRNPS